MNWLGSRARKQTLSTDTYNIFNVVREMVPGYLGSPEEGHPTQPGLTQETLSGRGKV